MARKDPGKITCGTQGVGTPPHMAEALMSMRANVRMLQVPFKGGPETMTGLLSGLIDFTFAPIPVALPQVRSGRLRLLAMTTAQRSSLYPDVATVAEQGLPGYEVNYWYGLAAPSGTPREVVNVISKCTDEVLAMPEVREKLQGQGMEPAPMGPAAFTEYFSKELKFYGQLIHDAKIEPI
jgi:tripartite-type tricarboxylate transporter receptor subunit TctC